MSYWDQTVYTRCGGPAGEYNLQPQPQTRMLSSAVIRQAQSALVHAHN